MRRDYHLILVPDDLVEEGRVGVRPAQTGADLGEQSVEVPAQGDVEPVGGVEGEIKARNSDDRDVVACPLVCQELRVVRSDLLPEFRKEGRAVRVVE